MAELRDLYARFDEGAGYFDGLREIDDHYFTRPIFDCNPGPVMQFDGHECIIWSVNDYLGLANHPGVQRVAHDAIDRYGISTPMGSRMMTGNTVTHLRLERDLAAFVNKEAAYLFNYGYLGVLGIITALTGAHDTIVMDKLSHACIVDGAFLSGAKLRTFKHNDMHSLEAILRHTNRTRKGGLLIVTEGVYGMTGDVASLQEITELGRRYGARLLIDDAHGWGVMGHQGRGSGDYCGVQEQVDIYFGTFAKAFASIGGFSAGDKRVRDWISYNARTQVFAKSLPLLYVVTLQKTLELVRAGDDRRRHMWSISNALREGLRQLGYYVGSGESPICSVFIPIGARDLVEVCMHYMRWLREHGVFVTIVSYPVIPRGLAMIRVIPTAAHQLEHVARTIEVFRELREQPTMQLDLDPDERRRVDRLFNPNRAA